MFGVSAQEGFEAIVAVSQQIDLETRILKIRLVCSATEDQIKAEIAQSPFAPKDALDLLYERAVAGEWPK